MFDLDSFEYDVIYEGEGAFDFCITRLDGGRFDVFLPHQCSTWQIRRAKKDGYSTHGEAVEDLRTFINEAQKALAALEEVDSE